MQYIVKSSALFVIFYLVYIFFLKRETFFQQNRLFLLSGIFLSLLLPLWTIQKTIWIEPTLPKNLSIPNIYIDNISEFTEPKAEFNWELLFIIFYLIVCLGFAIHFLISLWSVRKQLKGEKTKIENLSIINNPNIDLPFSFFNFIVINEEKFKDLDRDYIMAHEKVHAKQRHSIDVLFVKIVKIFFWFHPIYWLYEKSVIHNLEFIADNLAIREVNNIKNYQKIMLLSTVHTKPLALTNSFYQSLIKKRIVMLNQKKSNPYQQWKFATVLPFLFIFMSQFQVQIIAQEKKVTQVKQINDESLIKYIFPNTSNQNIENMVAFFKKNQVKLDISSVKRNTDDLIIAIHVKISHGKQKLEWKKKGNQPIEGFQIKMDINYPKNISIESIKDQFVVISSEDEDFDLKNTIAVGGFADNNKTFSDDNTVYVVDGKIMESTDIQKQINNASLVVVHTKKEDILKYGAEVVRVIEIKTRPITYSQLNNIEDSSLLLETKVDKHNLINESQKVEHFIKEIKLNIRKELILLDNEPISFGELIKIKPNEIDNIKVLKDKAALEKYGEKGKNGVFVITTKEFKMKGTLQLMKYQLYEDNLPKKNITESLALKDAESKKKKDKIEIEDLSMSFKVHNPSEKNQDVIHAYEDAVGFFGEQIDIKKALLFLDDQEITYQEFIKHKEIPVMSMLKGNNAIKKYGEKGKHGVVYLFSKPSHLNLSGNSKLAKNFRINDDNDGFIIHKNSTSEDIEFYTKTLQKNNLKLKVAIIKRNSEGQITNIDISLRDGKNIAKASFQTQTGGIQDVFVGKRNGKLVVSSSN